MRPEGMSIREYVELITQDKPPDEVIKESMRQGIEEMKQMEIEAEKLGMTMLEYYLKVKKNDQQDTKTS